MSTIIGVLQAYPLPFIALAVIGVIGAILCFTNYKLMSIVVPISGFFTIMFALFVAYIYIVGGLL